MEFLGFCSHGSIRLKTRGCSGDPNITICIILSIFGNIYANQLPIGGSFIAGCFTFLAISALITIIPCTIYVNKRGISPLNSPRFVFNKKQAIPICIIVVYIIYLFAFYPHASEHNDIAIDNDACMFYMAFYIIANYQLYLIATKILRKGSSRSDKRR